MYLIALSCHLRCWRWVSQSWTWLQPAEQLSALCCRCKAYTSSLTWAHVLLPTGYKHQTCTRLTGLGTDGNTAAEQPLVHKGFGMVCNALCCCEYHESIRCSTTALHAGMMYGACTSAALRALDTEHTCHLRGVCQGLVTGDCQWCSCQVHWLCCWHVNWGVSAGSFVADVEQHQELGLHVTCSSAAALVALHAAT